MNSRFKKLSRKELLKIDGGASAYGCNPYHVYPGLPPGMVSCNILEGYDKEGKYFDAGCTDPNGDHHMCRIAVA